MAEHLAGLLAPPFAPLHPDGSLHPERVEPYAAFLARNGVRGAFVNGTTGESLSLSVAERKTLAQRWVAAAPQDFAVIVHVGHPCLADSQALAAHAQEAGACAIGAMAPCFFKPASACDLADWCAEVAAAAPELPFYYYHIPAMTGVDIPVADFLRAAADRVPSLAGAKFTYEDLMDYTRCVGMEGGRYDMLFGRDEILLSALVLGARGAIGTTYNFAAPLFLRVLEAYRAGDLARARAEQARAAEMVATLAAHGGVPVFKAAMRLAGFDCGPVRLPLRDLGGDQVAALRADLERIGFFETCCRP
ncbi:MAG: dihydrodipicolinate synthase family protein [Candidatus Brocadiia bacterium]